ncbi:MAG: RNA methyltransferase [Candidatus Peribacteria bacterium]|nr:MAG: RNA methyltransferase [Candidatus Peribacteria bacterium]
MAIHSSQLQPPSCADKPITMAIALPNTGNKLDMIVEKLTEVGVHHIIFFSAERSQIRTLEDKKLYRLHILAIEAAEQSHRWTIPTIQYIQHIHDVLSVDGSKVIFDKEAT